jgi:hypothetical protein
MPIPLVAILANMPPPQVLIDIPVDQQWYYELAGPIFLSLAAIFAGWWLIRYRSLRSVSSRVMFLACAGSLAASYTAFWIWWNRDSGVFPPNLGGSLASQMYLFWLEFSMLFFVYTRWNQRECPQTESDKSSTWPLHMLISLMFVGAGATVLLAPRRMDVWPTLLAGFWFVAFVIWGIVSSVRAIVY